MDMDSSLSHKLWLIGFIHEFLIWNWYNIENRDFANNTSTIPRWDGPIALSSFSYTEEKGWKSHW